MINLTILGAGNGDSSAIYLLKKIINNSKNITANLLFEFHNKITSENENGLTIFRERNIKTHNYKAFINSGEVDLWVAKEISYAIKIDTEWFIAVNGGANDYLGSGGTAVIDIRNYCANNNVKILFIEEDFNTWIKNHSSIEVNNLDIKNTIDISNKDEKMTFEKISLILIELFENFEKTPKTFNLLDEPDIRNLTISSLNTHNDFLSKGEVFNKEGKADLWVYSKNTKFEYFYEFKIWNNKKEIIHGLNQTCQKYSTHKNKCNGLVVFNKKNKDFSKVIRNVENIIAEYKEIDFKEIKRNESGSSITYSYLHPNSSDQNCILKVMIFDIYNTGANKR